MKLSPKKLWDKPWVRAICLFALISILLELSLFNFRHFMPMAEHYAVSKQNTTFISGFDASEEFLTSKSRTCEVEFSDINKRADNIYLDIETGADVRCFIYYKDEGSTGYYRDVPSIIVDSSVSRSLYIPMNLYGKAQSLKFRFEAQNDAPLILKGIELNRSVPFQVHPIRPLAIFLLLMFIWLFRPKSPLYSIKLNLKSIKQRAAVIAVIAFQFTIMLLIPLGSTSIDTGGQYQRLTDAFLEGRVYMKDIPDPKLEALENVYDYTQRDSVQAYALWDFSFYNHKYYIYFGPVPVLTAYLPYKAITGEHVESRYVYLAFAMLAIVGMFAIFKCLCQRFFKKCPLPVFLLLYLAIVNGSLLLFSLRGAMFYDSATASGLAFSTFGLWLLLESFKEGAISRKSNLVRLACSALLIALSVGCRPTFIFMAVFAVVLFAVEMIAKHRLKDGIKPYIMPCVCFLMPFILIGGALMWYNYIRFDSPFEFGAKYQLTLSDTRQYKITQLGRLPTGLFNYLFNFPSFNLEFPFIHPSYTPNYFRGYMFVYNAFPLFANLLPCALFGYVFFGKDMRKANRHGYFMGVGLLGIALLMCVMTIMFGGINTHYSEDFFWLFLLSASVAVIMCYEQAKSANTKKYLKAFVMSACLLGVLINIAVPLNNNFNWKMDDFIALRHIFAFWL
ncbi:MAG: hypothetical protein LBS03_09220 [Bacteroidales bacterium]|nr:hypothetical protein [Bacteroidales bacterium]